MVASAAKSAWLGQPFQNERKNPRRSGDRRTPNARCRGIASLGDLVPDHGFFRSFWNG